MNEQMLDDVLTEYYERDFSEFSNSPKHKFSLKHRLAMRKIFRIYARNMQSRRSEIQIAPAPADRSRSHKSLKTKIIIAIAVIICAVLFAGSWMPKRCYFDNFCEIKYHEKSLFRAINYIGTPQSIEERYVLSEIPSGFDLIDYYETDDQACATYDNPDTGRHFYFRQYTKKGYSTYLYPPKNGDTEYIKINGRDGVLKYSKPSEQRDYTILIWDCGDYILKIQGNVPKELLLDLANSTKIEEN